MKKTKMKHLLRVVAALLFAVLTLPSCLKNSEEVTSSQCAIVSFSVGNVSSLVTVKKYDSHGNATDTVVKRTVLGSDIYFNIDQVNGRIHVVDSLPYWMDLTRMVPSYSSYGNVYIKTSTLEDSYYRLANGSDSIDFSKKVELMCVSTDGTATRHYEVDIYKHKVNTDTISWNETSSNLSLSELSKVFCVDEQVYVFGRNTEDKACVATADKQDASNWNAPATIPVDEQSVILFRGKFYGLDSEGYICSATPTQAGSSWSRVSDLTVERLLAADDLNLYAYDGNYIMGSSDLTTWSVQGTTDLNRLPQMPVSSVTYEKGTNSNLKVAVMGGINEDYTDYAVTWYKVTATDADTNQPWAYIQVTSDNAYGLPRLSHLSFAFYKNAIFALGETEEAQYQYLYRSDDNGITWHPQTAKYPVPEGLDAANGTACIAAVGQELWIIQENGTVWQGSIQ